MFMGCNNGIAAAREFNSRYKKKDLKEEAVDRTMWRARFGRGFGPVVRQTTKRMNK